MKTLKSSRLVHAAVLPVAAAAALALAPAAAQTASADSKQATTHGASKKSTTSSAYRALRASHLLGKEVRNPQGKNIGQIRDLVVDMNSGQVRYAQLEFDPGIFQGERLFAVPTTELRLGSDDQLVYNMTRDKLEQAAVPRNAWNERWREPDYLAKLDKVWGVVQPSQNARAYRVSDLLGKDVHSRSGEEIGELEDLVVNMATQKVHYAVLEFDPSWTTPEKNYAFPLTAFNLGVDRDELILDVDKSKIRTMKGFNDSRWSNLDDRNWVVDVDRYLITVVPASARGTATGGSASGKGTASASPSTTPAELFVRLDDNRNGWLDKAEVKDSADVDRNWDRYDKDKNGRISLQEFAGQYTIEASRKVSKGGGS